MKGWLFTWDMVFSVLVAVWSAFVYQHDNTFAIYLVLIAILLAIHALIDKGDQ